MPLRFDNTYSRLPERFFVRQPPLPVREPQLVAWDDGLAEDIAAPKDASIWAGNRLPDGAGPLALAYAGHQFGGFVPQLGDGRAILLGEVLDRQGQRLDLQLKGSGPTPFSRRGDGRAALGPMLREFLVSNAMHALGIPTTRSLAVATTGEPVYRETPLPGAVLARVAASHIRVGTFQYFAARGDREGVETLLDYAIQRHFTDAKDASNPALAFLEQVITRQARLVAQWLNVGFIHGVMNTDNMAISGETIDYGPCAFMDAYDPQAVFSSIDHAGRYAYANQPTIAQWNLARLAECLLPLMDVETAQEALAGFVPAFQTFWLDGMRRKLGLSAAKPEDEALAGDLLVTMQRQGLDFTNTFRGLYRFLADGDPFPAALGSWLPQWQARLEQETAPLPERLESMRRANPAFIPRNHQVEKALAAANAGDFTLFVELRQVLLSPYDDQPEHASHARPPEPSERVHQTFCGT